MPGSSALLVGTPTIRMGGLAKSVENPLVGTEVNFQDLFWGGGTAVLAKTAAALAVFSLVTLTHTYNSSTKRWELIATAVPNTANLGTPVGICMDKATAADQYVWVKVRGLCPVNSAAAVAANTAFGIGAAGQGGAVSAGKQVLGARIVAASTTTVAKTNCVGRSGSYEIQVKDSDGWFVGAYLSGTGVGSGAVVTAIDATGTKVTVSVANSATISGTVTATYNNSTVFFNIASLDRPHMQGQDATS